MHQLADSNAWFGGSGYEPSHTEIEAGWGDPYEGEQQVLSNPVDPGLFDVPAWRTLREARSLIAVRITGHPDGQLDTDLGDLGGATGHVREGDCRTGVAAARKGKLLPALGVAA